MNCGFFCERKRGTSLCPRQFVNACCAMVDRLPLAGESLRATSITAEPGGKGFNVAVGARRLGAEVDCLAAIGDDLFGQMAPAAFRAAGLSDALLRRCETPTGAGVGFIQANGENCLAVFPGANLSLSAADVRAHTREIEAARMVLAQFEIGDPPILKAFAIARRVGRATLLNPSPFRIPTPEILAATTILVLNERETLAMASALGFEAGRVDRDSASRLARLLHANGLETLIVTLGARGALAYPREGPPISQPAYAVEAIDTLGAGDAFIALWR